MLKLAWQFAAGTKTKVGNFLMAGQASSQIFNEYASFSFEVPPDATTETFYVTNLVYISATGPVANFIAATSANSLIWLSVGPDSIKVLSTIPNVHGAKATDGIACVNLLYSGTENATLLTGGHDGTIKAWHASEGKLLRTFMTVQGEPVSTITSNGDVFAVGVENPNESANDTAIYIYSFSAADDTPFKSYVESHSDTITQLLFADIPKPRLMSSSTDNTLNCFDMKAKHEDDAVDIAVNNQSPINHFVVIKDDEDRDTAVVISTDEYLRVHTLWEDMEHHANGVAASDKNDLRRELECDYVIRFYPARTENKPLLCVGSCKPLRGNQPRIDVFEMREAPTIGYFDFDEEAPECEIGYPQWSLLLRLEGKGHGDEVVRDIWIGDVEGGQTRVVTVGEDGMVRAWKGVKAMSRAPTKAKKEKGTGSRRHKPY